jgi:hypothetical protein
MAIVPDQGADAWDLDTPGGVELERGTCSRKADTLGQVEDRNEIATEGEHYETRESLRGTGGGSHTVRTRPQPAS